MKVEWKTCFRVGISVFLVFLGIYYWSSVAGWISLFTSAATPLLVGCVIAYILNILMSFYEKHYFPRAKGGFAQKSRRAVCLVLAIATFLGIVAAVVGLVLPELTASVQLLIDLLIDWLPTALEDLSNNELLAELISPELLQSLESVDWQGLVTKVLQFVTDGIGGAVGTVAGAISSVISQVVTIVVAVIFSLYLLVSRDRLLSQGSRLMEVYLRPAMKKRCQYVLSVLNDCFHRYVVGQCLEAVILGCLCMLGMFIFRFPYATMIGTLVGFTALIPIAGAYIGAAVGAFMILTVSPLKALLFLVYLTVLQQLEGNLIYPRVVGTSIGLPGMWVLAAVTVGGGLFGILGMLAGVPLAAAAYRLLREDVNRREQHGGGHHRRTHQKKHSRQEEPEHRQSQKQEPGPGRSGHELPKEFQKQAPKPDQSQQMKQKPVPPKQVPKPVRPEPNQQLNQEKQTDKPTAQSRSRARQNARKRQNRSG